MALEMRTKIYRWMPMIGYHHILMIISAIAVIMLSILLAGCSSNSLSNIYLLSLEYTAKDSPLSTAAGQVSSGIAHAIHNVLQTGNGTTLEVRAGYMGICVTQSHTGRICSTNAQVLANLFQAQKHVKNGTSTEIVPDPLNLIMIANEFKEKIVFDGLIYIVIVLIFICFLMLSSFPGWTEEIDDSGSVREVKPFPSRPVSQTCLLGFLSSAAFCLISVLWQHINSSAAATMAETLTYGAVSAHVGGAAMALGWLSLGLIAAVSIGMLVMILSISLLRKLTEE
ncbi:hypothetical protein N7517_007581 [Penicillium concentricum]|uniref:Membrane fusion mating protein FIG1 n=1 Tax=Penicillium concentricum TaxID=293559 RepID=A0A9W9SBZ4_9EURO|nr:uncharacterized protein N7517_007581 [Penicillium concentricum]KAJ5375575.1 hypothetical protein N7517_007581 [Penicillium concentricum]